MKPLSPNTLLQNRYLIVHLIGRGGMGEVYLAIDQRLGNAVALKRTSFSDDALLGSAFEREAKTLARLRHNALPKVSDHFLEEDNQYLIMEFIAGDDLSKRLENSKKAFPLAWVMFWADGLLDALNYLHSNEPPIIHRDIKPQNLKLTEENSIVLLDFGLSKNTLDAASQTLATTTGSSVVGYTPHYAPLEQIRGTGTNARSDIYSLSATLYQLLANVVPPDALTRAEAVLGELPDPLQPLNEINKKVSPAISEIISKGMEISRDKRFAGARQMQTALRDAHSLKQIAVSKATQSSSSLDEASVSFPSQPFANEIKQPQTSGHDKFSTTTRIDSESADDWAETANTDDFATFTPTENHAAKDFLSSEFQLTNKENHAPVLQKSPPENKSSQKSLFAFAGVGAFFLLIATIAAALYLFKSSAAIDKSAATALPEATAENTPTTIEAATAKSNVDANSVSTGETISNTNSNRETAEKSIEKTAVVNDNSKVAQPTLAKVNPKSSAQIAETPKQTVKTAAPKPKATPTLPRILP